jgi:uncharacterized protein YndB with AHSA1/START domain
VGDHEYGHSEGRRIAPGVDPEVEHPLADQDRSRRPEEWDAGPHELDFREGGREVGSGGPKGGATHTYRAIYWEVVPKRIVYTYELLLDEVRTSVALVTVELKPDGEGTLLTLTEHAAFFDGLEDPARRRDGTGSLLDALALEVEREP